MPDLKIWSRIRVVFLKDWLANLAETDCFHITSSYFDSLANFSAQLACKIGPTKKSIQPSKESWVITEESATYRYQKKRPLQYSKYYMHMKFDLEGISFKNRKLTFSFLEQISLNVKAMKHLLVIYAVSPIMGAEIKGYFNNLVSALFQHYSIIFDKS